MSAYLEIKCGDYRLLINQDLVQEIVSGKKTIVEGGYRWHDQKIASLSLRENLGLADRSSQHQIVIDCSSNQVHDFKILLVDEVVKIHEISDDVFMPTPNFNPEFSHLIEASYFSEELNQCYLKLKDSYFRQ